MKFTLKEITLSSLFAALTAIGAQIAVPTPFVPITLETFFVHLAGIVLGKKCGAISQIVLLLLGAVGLPVFSQFRGGLHVILGPTGGYLLSFPIIAYLTGLLLESKPHVKKLHIFFISVLGLIICYTMGTIQLSIVAKLNFVKAIFAGVIPFIPFDIVKLLLATIIGYHVRNSLIKAKIMP